MELKVGDLFTHRDGYRAILLENREDYVRICVFYHSAWCYGRTEIWTLDRMYLIPEYLAEVQNGV